MLKSINSELRHELAMNLFTIGHSNHTIEAFIALLQQHEVTAVADVRSHPYSRYLPHFKQAALKKALNSVGIWYVFLGRELGARPDNPACYVDGKAVYEKIARTDSFHTGIARLLAGARKYQIALLCAEKDPLTCHRAILICQHLRANLTIHHILNDGNLESHHQLEDRMLARNGFANAATSHLAQLSLFEAMPGREGCLVKAYTLQADQIAYVEQRESDHEPVDQFVHDRVHPKECAIVL